MARGDVQNDMYISLANGATSAIQPGSGDEFLFEYVQGDSDDWNIEGYDGSNNTDPLHIGVFGGTTAIHETNLSYWGSRRMKWGITNSEYLRVINNAGFTDAFAWSGLETK